MNPGRCAAMTMMLALLPLVSSCTDSTSRESAAVFAEAGEKEFGGGMPVDTIEVARAAGYDYAKIVDGCLQRDRQAMHTFFSLDGAAHFDAASAQGHATVSGILLRRLGDPFFGECLAAEPPAVREAMQQHILYDLGWGNTDETLAQLRQRYPRTLAGYEEE